MLKADSLTERGQPIAWVIVGSSGCSYTPLSIFLGGKGIKLQLKSRNWESRKQKLNSET